MARSSANDFSGSQPVDDEEKEQVASEAMGMSKNRGTRRPKAPKFHRMSIEAAENGFSIEHTAIHEPSDSDRGKDSTDPFQGHKNTKHVFTHDHPMAGHIRALNAHITGNDETAHGGADGPVSANPLGGAQHPRGPQNR